MTSIQSLVVLYLYITAAAPILVKLALDNRVCHWVATVLHSRLRFMKLAMPSDFIMNKVGQTGVDTYECLHKTYNQVRIIESNSLIKHD